MAAGGEYAAATGSEKVPLDPQHRPPPDSPGSGPSPRTSSRFDAEAPLGSRSPSLSNGATGSRLAKKVAVAKTARTKSLGVNMFSDMQNTRRMTHGSLASDASLIDTAKRQFLRQEQETPPGIIHPEGNFRLSWDAIQVFTLCYVALSVPMNIGFDITLDPGSAIFYVDLFVDLYFVADIYINFHTAFFDNMGEIVVDKKEIRRKYKHGFFCVDILSSLPIPYIMLLARYGKDESVDGAARGPRVFRLLRLFKLAKLLRLAKFKAVLKRFDDHLEGLLGSMKLLAMAALLAYVAHLIACSWWMVGWEEHQERDQGWVTRWEWALSDPNATEFKDDTIAAHWLVAFYWAITTLSSVGYGDVAPTTHMEMTYCVVAELIGTMCFGMIIGLISTLIQSKGHGAQLYGLELGQLREYMKSKNLSLALRRRVRAHMHILHERSHIYDEREILKKLPPGMQAKILAEIYGDKIAAMPLFKCLNAEELNALYVAMKPFPAHAGMVIYAKGDVAREIFFIMSGSVRESFSERIMDMKRQPIQAGSFFGEEIWTKSTQLRKQPSAQMELAADTTPKTSVFREMTVLALTECELVY